ncbi:hypothetical protein Tco_1534774, partial [Tanacetum coccineum]
MYSINTLSMCEEGELLDFNEFIPAYSTATDEQIGKGVNYGSGGAGIRRGTGRHL